MNRFILTFLLVSGGILYGMEDPQKDVPAIAQYILEELDPTVSDVGSAIKTGYAASKNIRGKPLVLAYMLKYGTDLPKELIGQAIAQSEAFPNRIDEISKRVNAFLNWRKDATTDKTIIEQTKKDLEKFNSKIAKLKGESGVVGNVLIPKLTELQRALNKLEQIL